MPSASTGEGHDNFVGGGTVGAIGGHALSIVRGVFFKLDRLLSYIFFNFLIFWSILLTRPLQNGEYFFDFLIK